MRALLLTLAAAAAIACGGSTEPADSFAGQWTLTDTLDASSTWQPVTGGSLSLGADHRFTLMMPPSTRPQQTGDWTASTATQDGKAVTIVELQANPGWLGINLPVRGVQRLVLRGGSALPQYAFMKQ